MCGILYTDDPGVARDRFLASLQLIQHRGPDASGYYCHGHAQLGHNRLKIIDIDDRSNQPFVSADGRYVIIFNGEVYNFRELAREHVIAMRTACDTEVVVELYARFGPTIVSWLNGMFAFVIMDTQTREVFAARDRLGVKPLYMHRQATHLTLGSELAAVLSIVNVSGFDEFGLRQYRKLRTFFNGRTLYSGIEMFPAGHYLSEGKLVCYWRLPEGAQKAPSLDELREIIVESVRQRRLADVPVGSYLSGGLDSTIIAVLAGEPHTWTVGFKNCNEFRWARLVADRIKSIHHEVLITAEEFVDLAREMIRVRREPLSVPNEVLLYKMTREVKHYNTVILSGEGADELFFGYDRIFRWANDAKTLDLQKFDQLYSYGTHDDREVIEDALSPFLHLDRPIDVVAAFFQVSHLHGLLRRLDNATMLCSVEARVPFVDDHRLIERMSGVPFEFRMADGEVKAPLKRMFSTDIPAEIRTREKLGFPVPLQDMSFVSGEVNSPMEQWLLFNLVELGAVSDEDFRLKCPVPA